MYNNILFPVDLEHTKEAEKALKIAVEEAQRSKAKLTVMTAAPGFGMPIVASFFEKWLFNKADKIISVSNEVKGEIVSEYKISPSKINTI